MVTPSPPLLSLLTFLEVTAGSDPTSTDTHTRATAPVYALHPSPLMDHSTHKHTQLRDFFFFFPASVLLSQPPPQTGNLSFHSSSSGPLIPSFSLSLSLYSLLLFFSHVHRSAQSFSLFFAPTSHLIFFSSTTVPLPGFNGTLIAKLFPLFTPFLQDKLM